MLIPIGNACLLIAHSLFPDNVNIYIPFFILNQFYCVDFCILKFFLVSFNYNEVLKTLVDDLYSDICAFLGAFQPDGGDDTCFTEYWYLRFGLLFLFFHVLCYYGTEYIIWRSHKEQIPFKQADLEYAGNTSINENGKL